jgi:UDP:flavonoid glycosyltransferase YjiC (YdhE family)
VNTSARARVLFVSENVTLAQVVRLVTLARSLDPARYEVHFACSRFDDLCFAGTHFVRHPLYTIAEEELFQALEAGKRPYEEPTLMRYAEDELALFERVRPRLVVGDFRLSLAASAPLAGVPLATLINAYFSPFAVRDAWPVPDHPIVNLVGVKLAERYFPLAMPRVFEHFARPVNALRRHRGLARIGSLLEVLTFGDYTLYPDIPELTPTDRAPASHIFLGAVPWSPPVPPPAVWQRMSARRPAVYVTLGSSGNLRVLPQVLEGLAKLPIDVMLATAGRKLALERPLPDNVYAAEFVPGPLAARRAELVISNGGSSTGYQALAEGTPVVGIASNFDQYLAMHAIERRGAGLLLRASTLTAETVTAAVGQVLGDRSFREAAGRLAAAFARYDARERFGAFVARALKQRAPVVGDARRAQP